MTTLGTRPAAGALQERKHWNPRAPIRFPRLLQNIARTTASEGASSLRQPSSFSEAGYLIRRLPHPHAIRGLVQPPPSVPAPHAEALASARLRGARKLRPGLHRRGRSGGVPATRRFPASRNSFDQPQSKLSAVPSRRHSSAMLYSLRSRCRSPNAWASVEAPKDSAMIAQVCLAPTVSAITAPRAPSGLSPPTVESRAYGPSTM